MTLAGLSPQPPGARQASALEDLAEYVVRDVAVGFEGVVVTHHAAARVHHLPGRTIRLKRLFSEGGESIKLHMEGSLTIPNEGY